MIKKISYLLAAILLLSLIYLSYDYYSFVHQRDKIVQKKGIETTEALKNQVDKILAKIVVEGNRLAELLGSNEYSTSQIEAIVKESALSIPEIQGVTACFEPYAFSSERRLYCPYYDKSTQDFLFVGTRYDYSDETAEGTAWYTGVRDNGAKWVEPYFGQGAMDWYIDYGIPFHYNTGPNKGKVRGTITMSFSCGGFKNLVHSMSLGKTGYGIITSQGGKFLSHPVNEYIGTRTLEEIKSEETQPQLITAFEEIQKGNTGNTTFFDKERQDQTLFFYDKIPTSGWGLGLVFFKNDLLGDTSELNHRYIHLAIVLSLFFICILAIYFGKDYLDENEIWTLSGIASVLFLANIFLVGYLQHFSGEIQEQTKSQPIIDLTSLNKFINQRHARSEELKTPKATPIPTGLYIQRLEFEDSYNLNVGGNIWQKYPLDIAETVEIGFNLPQLSPFAEASYIEETYREKIESKEGEAGYLLVGWEFRVTLRLNLKYADFPFDKRHISIEILPKSMKDHLVFTPDLSSYNYTNPSKKSGLNHKIHISGSNVLQSYFNYSLETYDADFGYGVKGLFEEVPVLHYNIDLQRNLLNSFITYLIPIFVTLVMVFILILSCSKTAERQGVIESMAAFFFVLIFSHIDLRKEIVTADLIYMEYFYFVSYFMLILATFNLITYTKDKSDIFDFNDNQIFKASFFPLFFLIMLIITLSKFY